MVFAERSDRLQFQQGRQEGELGKWTGELKTKTDEAADRRSARRGGVANMRCSHWKSAAMRRPRDTFRRIGDFEQIQSCKKTTFALHFRHWPVLFILYCKHPFTNPTQPNGPFLASFPTACKFASPFTAAPISTTPNKPTVHPYPHLPCI